MAERAHRGAAAGRACVVFRDFFELRGQRSGLAFGQRGAGGLRADLPERDPVPQQQAARLGGGQLRGEGRICAAFAPHRRRQQERLPLAPQDRLRAAAVLTVVVEKRLTSPRLVSAARPLRPLLRDRIRRLDKEGSQETV